MKKLSDLQRIFGEPGHEIDFGCSEAEYEKMVELCHEMNSRKSVCVVASWIWWDIISDNPNFPQPTYIVKADNVLFDEKGRFPVGGWVRTSPLKALHQNCIFETGNTFYVLVGEGTRKEVSASDALAFI